MGMFYNGVKCDIYIGKGAGKKLLEDIKSAKETVKIVSPYLSPSLIKELIYLHNNNISIELITSDNIEDFKNNNDKNIYKLIRQHRETDIKNKTKRQKWKKYTKIIGWFLVFLFIVLVIAVKQTQNKWLAVGLIPLILIFFYYDYLKIKIRKIRIYNYSYSKLFPFKVFISPYESKISNTLIHGKIYIIDDKIAYLGSLNLTKMGTKYNYETRVRVTDSKAISKINEELDNLYYNSNIPEKDIQFWGKQLYSEPIN